MPGITNSILKRSIDVDYDKLKEDSKRAGRLINSASEVRIKLVLPVSLVVIQVKFIEIKIAIINDIIILLIFFIIITPELFNINLKNNILIIIMQNIFYFISRSLQFLRYFFSYFKIIKPGIRLTNIMKNQFKIIMIIQVN